MDVCCHERISTAYQSASAYIANINIGHRLTLPFLAIFLSQQRGMTPGQTGLVLGMSLMLAIVLSLYGGYRVDRFNKQQLILCAMTSFAISIPLFVGRHIEPVGHLAIGKSNAVLRAAAGE